MQAPARYLPRPSFGQDALKGGMDSAQDAGTRDPRQIERNG